MWSCYQLGLLYMVKMAIAEKGKRSMATQLNWWIIALGSSNSPHVAGLEKDFFLAECLTRRSLFLLLLLHKHKPHTRLGLRQGCLPFCWWTLTKIHKGYDDSIFCLTGTFLHDPIFCQSQRLFVASLFCYLFCFTGVFVKHFCHSRI